MADPVTAGVAVGVGLLGAAATLTGAAVTGGIGVATLGYNAYKDRKSAKSNKNNNNNYYYNNNQVSNTIPAKNQYNPNVVYQPSASYQKSGTEKVSFGPDGRFSAVGTNTNDWSCGTITFYASDEQVNATKKQKKSGGFFGRSSGPPPPYP